MHLCDEMFPPCPPPPPRPPPPPPQGLGREMIVVVDDLSGPSPCVGDDVLSEREVKDLNRGRAFVRHYLECGSSVLEETVETAVQTTAKVSCASGHPPHTTPGLMQRCLTFAAVLSQVLRDSLTVSTFSQRSRPLRLSVGEELGDELFLIRQVFMMYDHSREGRLTLQEVIKWMMKESSLLPSLSLSPIPSFQAEVALKSLHIEVPSILSTLEVNGMIKSCDRSPDRSHDLVSHYKQNGISFEDFCTLYAEIKYGDLQSPWSGPVYNGIRYLFSQLSWIGCEYMSHLMFVGSLFVAFSSHSHVVACWRTSSTHPNSAPIL